MNTAEWLRGRVLLAVVIAATVVHAVQADRQTAHTTNLRTFTNRAGWSVKYPRNWHFKSCRQCDDPTEPHALLFLSNPSGDQTIMIERLADKPDGKADDAWLHEVAKDTVLSPIRREEWITLGGSKALKVVNDGSENIYAAHRSLTIAIRYDRAARATIQVISTFKFEQSEIK